MTDRATVLERGQTQTGDPTRLRTVMRRAQRGETIRLGFIGGSITQGAWASSPERRWVNRVVEWWRATFPETPIEFVNAGIGATDSYFGAHRAQAHLLDSRPDFVVVEYAVNDPAEPLFGETVEGLVRQVLAQPSHPAVMLLFTMNDHGGNAQDVHAPVGEHYALPMVSYRDALWPEVEAGRVAWDDLAADDLHPKDLGHAWCADLIVSALERVRAETSPPTEAPPPQLPPPLISDVFARTAMFHAETLRPTLNNGWRLDSQPGPIGPGWTADRPGSELTFSVEGTAFGILFHRIQGDMGMLEARVDDAPPVRLDAWYDRDWGGYSLGQLVARDLAPGTHTLRLRLLDETNPASTGHRFQVQAVLCAGRDEAKP